MRHTGEPQDAALSGPTFQDALTALEAVLPKPKDGAGRNDFEIVTAAEREITRLREYAALPVAAETPEATPGWRELSYEEPPYDKAVLFRRNGEIPYVGVHVKPDPEDDDGEHGLLISIDGDLYDGDPPNLWSEIPDYYYDDVAAIAATMDGDGLTSDDDDADTAEEIDDSEVFYRDIDDPPPVGEMVLLLTMISDGEGDVHGEDPIIGWCGDDGIYYTMDGGEEVEVDEPNYWSHLPKLPNLDS